MLKPFIAGALALVFAIGAAPEQARADHGDRIIGGIVVGAILGATVAAITDNDRRRGRVYYDRGYRRPPPVYRAPAPVYRRHYGPPPRVVQRRLIRRDRRIAQRELRRDRRIARRELRRDRRVARRLDRRIDRLEDRVHRDDHRRDRVRYVYGEYRN